MTLATPLRIGPGMTAAQIIDSNGKRIGIQGERIGLTELVRRANAHDGLVGACEAAYLVLGYDAEGDTDAAQASRELRAALAAAKGE